MKLLLVDDHAVVRSGLRMLLETQPDVMIVGEAESGEEAVGKARQLSPDVIVMDITLPDMSGIEATRRIHASQPGVAIVALTIHEDEQYFFEMMAAGASGYVPKRAAPEDLLTAIRAAHRGEVFLYPSLAKALVKDFVSRVDANAGRTPSAMDGLTEREREVLKHLAEGATNQDIGDVLNISANTVARHRENIMQKLNLHSRAELVKYAISLLHLWLAGLATVMLIGLAGAYLVFTRGLVVTGLSDKVPWGLWITVDLSSIALSAGAFSLSAAVYLLGLRQYRPVARVAVFIGLIGYTMALLTLLLDIGRPDRFWHALVFWNPHSVLWEVTMCVKLYLGVLTVEFAPMIGEAEWMRRRFPRLARLIEKLHQAAPALAIVGLGLSLLHQSSLGATYGVIKARPLWYKPDMSILFIVSALAGGPSLTVLACLVVAQLRKRACVDRSLIDGLARFIGFTLVAYLYLKFWDAFMVTYTYAPGRTEGLRLLTDGVLQWNFWLGEVVLGGLLPAFILLSEHQRADDRLLMLAAALIVLGVALNRWDVNLSGLLLTVSYLPSALVSSTTHYWPTWVEWATAAGVVAYGLTAFTLGARFLPVFASPHEEAHEEPAPVEPKGTVETSAA